MALPKLFVEHLRTEGYHPRSNKHSNSLARAIASDLVGLCPPMARLAAAGGLVYDLNFTLGAGMSDWNVDLVFGPPPPGFAAPVVGSIAEATPATVQIAIEIKSVMTEHRKAVKNRKRDFEAHHEHVHDYNPRTIAGGVMVVNIARTFRSPLRAAITEHRNVESHVSHCLDEMRSVSLRSAATNVGLDAKAFLVLDMDNSNLGSTVYRETPPAPQVGDALHYDAFIQRVCDEFTQRFAD